ncbi:hypothetical protein EV361DRAFT_867068 [Lentinula raphanica]|nr:hypothetical protein EV361DRAFT_867068 [Lentinula raphanica]
MSEEIVIYLKEPELIQGWMSQRKLRQLSFNDTGPKFQLNCPSPELLALSLASQQLRRACLPFLFAKIKISHDEDAKKLENHLALKLTKTLVLGSSGDLTEVGEQIIKYCLNSSNFSMLSWEVV